jgi:ATP-dependent DNA ligase
MLLSSEENLVFGMEHIENALDALPIGHELDGELYCHGMSFEEIFSRTSRTTERHPDVGQIGYHIFDICDEEMAQVKRVNELYLLVDQVKPPLHIVSTMIAEDIDQVMFCYETICNAGYEGIIVRHAEAPYVRKRSIWMMKFKPKKSDQYRIVGWKEEVSISGAPKNRLGALICTSGEEEFSVGSGLTDDQREELWEEREGLVGKWCIIEYQHTTPGRGVPRFPVLMSIL